MADIRKLFGGMRARAAAQVPTAQVLTAQAGAQADVCSTHTDGGCCSTFHFPGLGPASRASSASSASSAASAAPQISSPSAPRAASRPAPRAEETRPEVDMYEAAVASVHERSQFVQDHRRCICEVIRDEAGRPHIYCFVCKRKYKFGGGIAADGLVRIGNYLQHCRSDRHLGLLEERRLKLPLWSPLGGKISPLGDGSTAVPPAASSLSRADFIKRDYNFAVQIIEAEQRWRCRSCGDGGGSYALTNPRWRQQLESHECGPHGRRVSVPVRQANAVQSASSFGRSVAAAPPPDNLLVTCAGLHQRFIM